MIFAEKGPVNTEKTLQLAVERGRELGIRCFVVASNTGKTARELLKLGVEAVVVTHHSGYQKPGFQEMPAEVMAELKDAGAALLTTTHLLGGIDRAVENKFGGSYPGGIVAHTLRMLGQGTKVCAEIAVMALDAGLIPHGEDVIAIGGSGRGADTAVVIRPAHAKDFFDCKIREIICKPGNF
ncbi:MAG: pyruvate kinase alpha/beta domain-containing protein [Bacillota bacterium]|nr:pyruvate kinase alpha/beta domain-containing protein [Bacillota bacterium]MDW7684027.1 pyruvate kinase alpha/beta domain-containing protein [Bacillota bacterium]